MKQTNLLGLGLLVIAFSSCQVKVGGVETDVSTAPAASIVGIWSTDCIADSSDSYIKSFQVENDTMTMATSRYQGTRTCDQASLSYTIMQSGALTISGDNTSIVGGKNYELQLNVVALVPSAPAFTAMINADNVCGINTWVSNQAGFIFGCNAAGGFDLSQVSFNTVHYGVFNIEAAATPNYLHFGEECAIAGYEGFCPAPADRPATLGGTVYFRR